MPNYTELLGLYIPSRNDAVPVDESLADNFIAIDRFLLGSGSRSVTSYGAKGDGVTDDTQAIQNTIDAVASSGGGNVLFPAGTFMIGNTITLKSKVKLIGAGRRTTIIKKKAGMNLTGIQTENFTSLTGTTIDGKTAPSYFAIKNLTLDGNYMVEDLATERFVSYVNTTGDGIKIYGREFDLDCEVINIAGVGVWVECNFTEGSPTFETKDYDIHVEIRDCRSECFILKGLADGRIHQLWCRGGGRRIFPDQDAMPPLSSENFSGYGYTDNIVFVDAGAEIGMIHSWGAYSGKGLRTIGQCRLLADLVITESCVFGGVQFNDGTYGQISNLKVHGCSGGRNGTMPDIEFNGTSRVFNVTSINHEARNVDTGQTAILVNGSFINIGHVNINKLGKNGHGIDLRGNFNTVGSSIINNGSGTAPDGLASSGFIRRADFTDRTLNANVTVVNFPVAFRSIGQADWEKITVLADLNTGASVFAGDLKNVHVPTNWEIIGNVAGAHKGTQYSASIAFDSATTVEQTLTFNHTLIGTPDLSRIHLSVQDTPSNLTNAISYYLVTSATSSQIVVKVRMSVAQGTNTAPRINLVANI